MEYLEQKGKRNISEFCVTASYFRRSPDNSQAQVDAVVLYEKFFSLQATCPLNVNDKIRFLVEEEICSSEAGTIKNSFEIPSRIIERFLEKRYFQGFLKSQLYKQYPSELLGKIEATGSSVGFVAGRKQIFFTDLSSSSNNPKSKTWPSENVLGRDVGKNRSNEQVRFLTEHSWQCPIRAFIANEPTWSERPPEVTSYKSIPANCTIWICCGGETLLPGLRSAGWMPWDFTSEISISWNHHRTTTVGATIG